MNRRKFSISCLLTISTVILADKKAFAVTWAIIGKMGYKEVAPKEMVAVSKTCGTCGWYRSDKNIPGAGLCKFPGVMKAANSETVYVKEGGTCSMWKRSF